jgi:hypothetical protein
MRQCGPSNRFAAQDECGQVSLLWLSAIVQLAGVIGCAHSQIFYGCRKRACGSSADSRLVFAGAARKLSRSPGGHRKGGHPDQIRAQMAGQGRPGHQPADNSATGRREASGGAVDPATT